MNICLFANHIRPGMPYIFLDSFLKYEIPLSPMFHTHWKEKYMQNIVYCKSNNLDHQFCHTWTSNRTGFCGALTNQKYVFENFIKMNKRDCQTIQRIKCTHKRHLQSNRRKKASQRKYVFYISACTSTQNEGNIFSPPNKTIKWL